MARAVGIVAAGGYGTRMGISRPKSMLVVDGVTLLEYTLMALQVAGMEDILVFSNREDCFDSQRRIVQRYRGAEVFKDGGGASTIELLYLARDICAAERYLFCYGSAPRTSCTYRDILDCPRSLGALGLPHSSRRDLIPSGDRLLEPPFLVEDGSLGFSRYYKSWSELFWSHGDNIYQQYSDHPPEFNDRSGWQRYRSYLCDCIIPELMPGQSARRGQCGYAAPTSDFLALARHS